MSPELLPVWLLLQSDLDGNQLLHQVHHSLETLQGKDQGVGILVHCLYLCVNQHQECRGTADASKLDYLEELKDKFPDDVSYV